jgi:Cys-tRNA(Pro)/Cys-tRNA(Cys) deacylase
MTPAVSLLKQKKIDYILHSYTPHPGSGSYGEEAAKALNQDTCRVFKTLVTELNGDPHRLGVAIVPVSSQLDLKRFAKAAGAKSATLAQPDDAQRITGYVLGGISPLGQKRQLPTVIDQSASGFPTVFVSAGKRGLQIEIKPSDLVRLTRASIDHIAK